MKTRALLLGLVLAACAGGASSLAGTADVLTEDSYWRWQVTMQPPTTQEGGKTTVLKRFYSNYNFWGDNLESPAPPDGWRKPDFDDSAWPRSRPKWLRELAFSRLSAEQVNLRGKFEVKNPSGANLSLTLKYIGGVVIYLNGEEIHRAHMPDGEVSTKTFADPYGKEFYAGPDGKLLSRYRSADADKWTLRRTRTAGPVKLPGDKIRKGVNVLAVEVHRSSFDPIALTWFTSKTLKIKPWWSHADLSEISLQGSGAEPNVARPAGFQVWVHDRNDRVTPADYADPNEPPGTVKLTGARNGSFCGQIVLGSTGPIKGAKVVAGDLAAAEGEGNIPASEVTVLYGLMNWNIMNWNNRAFGAWGHGLQEKPPAEVAVDNAGGGAVLPVLVRVHVPAEAAPGEYRGELTVSMAGAGTVKVPVELYVADWQVPDPQDYRTYMGIYQSPTSVAMKYGVDEWSEKHWELMDKSFALLGRVGNKLVNIPLVDETQFGNPEGMVYWVKKPDGGWEYDFSVFDRFLETVKKHCGPQDYVALQIWHAGGWTARTADNKCTVTVLDKKTGEKEPMQVPVFGTEESRKFWKPVLDEAQKRLAAAGMEKAMCMGILSDSTAPPEVFKDFAEVFPGGVKWQRGCHSATRSEKPYEVGKQGDKSVVVLHEHCYGMSMARPEEETLPQVHTFRGWPGTAYFRVSGHEDCTTLLSYRTMAERGLFCGKQGIGRICLDFWNVLGEGRKATHLYNRYPHSSCAQRQPTLKTMAWASPEGPATTMRFEALCEGLQDAEAVMVLSEAAAAEAKVGKELAEKCRALIRERMWYCWARDQKMWARSYVHMNHYGWQELSRRTYDLAAEVSKK